MGRLGRLLLYRPCHFIPNGVIQVFRLQFAQAITRCLEVVCQLLGESLVECGVFHVDDHALDLFVRNQFRETVGFFLRRKRADRNVARPIGHDDQERFDIRVRYFLVLQHIRRHQQPGGERGLAADRNVNQGALGKLDRIRGRQDQCGAILLEDDQPDPVAALVRIGQQRKDGALGGVHAFCHSHRPGGIHQKQNQVRHALDAHLALQVGGLDGKCQTLAFLGAPLLEGRGCAKGGIERNIVLFIPSRARFDVAAVFAVGLGQ